MALQKFTNNADSTGSGTLAQGATTLILTSGGGSKFPSPAAGEYFYLTLFQLDGSGNEVRMEIAKCTSRTADTLTIERDIEGIAAAAGSGAGGWGYPGGGYADTTIYVSLRMTAGTADNFLQEGYVGPFINAATSKATPVDADELALADSAAGNVLKKLTWANLKAALKTYFDSLATTLTNKIIALGSNTVSGTMAEFDAACTDGNLSYQSQAHTVTDLTISGSARRITGDFSENATLSNRAMFQSSVTNGASRMSALPNGTSQIASWTAYNNSTVTNAAFCRLAVDGTLAYIISGYEGSGSYLPLTLWTGGNERVRLDTSGNLGIGVSPSTIVHAKQDQDGKTRYLIANASAGTNASAGYGFSTSSGEVAYIGANGGAASAALGGASVLQITTLSALPIILATNNTERMRIAPTGAISFQAVTNNASTSGAITIDWRNGNNQKQAEPTGTITYTFTAPAGPCHLQLQIDSDGTSTAQTINWPGTVIWLGATWAGANNKKAVINFWYDGTNYYAQGSNQV